MQLTMQAGIARRMGHAVCCAAVLAMGTVAAQTPDANGAPPEPPPEAFAACKSLASGKECSVKTPDGTTIAGTCFAPKGKPLACKPKGAPPPPKQ